MHIVAAVLAALVLFGGTAAARDPLTGTLHSFFGGYRPAPPPVGGDCDAVAAAIGPEATWFGTFSGKRRFSISDDYNAYGAQACFDREVDCRVWQQRAINYADGPVQFTSCRRGAPRGLLR